MTKHQKTALLRICVAAALLIALHFVPVDGWLRFALYLIPYLTVGAGVLQRAVQGIANRQPFDENLLMAVATVGAMVLGEYPEGVAVMLFYQIGELFEDYAVGKSRRNISDLMDIRPDYANLETPDGLQKVAPEHVAVGSVIVVKPGERVPLDGTVLEGTSALNMAALTGESVPRDVAAGDAVISGSVNLTGVLRLRADKAYGESTVARILELVENSSLKKAKTEKFITKFARYYTPAVCLSALALAILPPVVRLLMGMSAAWGDWVYRALTFLVISCPCALVISIPLSFFGGIGGASSRGVLIKGASYLELLSKTDRVVFDKTGTLTRGTFEVTDVRPEQGVSAPELLQLAAAAERFSDHPVSLSLQKAAGELPEALVATDARELAGHGVIATVGGAQVAVGNEKLMHQLDLGIPACADAGTVVYVAVNGRYAGRIVIADRPKPGAAKAVAALKRCGVSRVVMLTGDRAQAAEAVAQELGIDEVCSELLPADKVTQVEKLLAEGGQKRYLAFVGDGINDAPVLARADLGVAMGAIGSDAAIEAADIVLMDDDPEKLPLAMSIARKTMQIVWQNIVFALAVKLVCLILGALGIAGMWLAIFADVGVMVLCVLNATRALSVKRL
ncbi:MAG: cadmium-translocating P-type ATPase [Oscillospiraceae bacterium]|nr:cadmium-translocating P-type ATPase [Oscillospiraceae bacterium]